ncbi:MAG: T9SS C-terminal target domain-containing protein, partial [Bacteroidetes bacterium]|nr:T9SS C-terminal target domain-containing protein [Bacteroidota bacterium]
GQLKLCAVRYRSRGVDFFTGPLITRGNSRGTTDIEVCYQYDRHWEVTRYQVDAFRNWYHADAEKRSIEYPGYTIPNVILNWPAHADASAGYDFYLAPFWDNNDDGYYNPADGDYPFYDLDGILPCGTSREHRRPRLFGDATLWWVYNDRGNLHQESGGEPIGMEFRAQAFEFSTNDALNDMSFYNYALINRSTYTLIETYFGCYVDGALGWAWDDFTGCHVSKGVGYFYNGETVDGSGEAWAYGASPPAIGIDFFEGPYQDPNGIDDCTSYDDQYKLICNECILNGNINGLNFGDGIVDNERWGMRRFVYYVNSSGVTGDPSTAPEYYNFLRGFWKDNERMRYGGNAHPAGGGDGPITDFMFPGESDPCGWGQGGIPMPFWSEETAGNEPYDRRMVQSSGPFVLEPGAINDITTGVVYARSYDGTPWASVTKMLQEDEKAQRLFENCFQVVDGPDAPELTIIEQDKKLIFHIWNKPTSNNYLEKYSERDPFIVCPLNDQDCNTNFEFQGYQVWQLKDHTVSITDATTHNSNLARVIFQCDLRDGISQIVNYEWNNEIEANQPVVEVEGANQGISHTFVVEEDLFATGIRTLVNFKEYYYLVVAYAYNSFKPYHQNDPDSNDGQKRPYLAGRRGAGGPIKTYPVIPHKVSPEEGGTLIRSDFGDSPAITRIEGHGTGRNIVDIDTLTHDAIMAGPPWKVDAITYQAGRSPINVTVADPLNLVNDNYTVRFDSVNYFVGSTMNGKVLSGKWLIHNSRGDTTFSESWISNNYDQLILDWGLAINITQEEIPYRYGSVNNGFLEATLEFEDSAEPWLWFIPDDDKSGPRNWIRAGYSGGDYSGDRDAIYEKILGGTWTTFKQAYIGNNGVANSDARSAIDTKRQRLANVDLYFTSDKSMWTRSPVIETTDDEALSLGNVEKFYMRAAQSVDKMGNPAVEGVGADSADTEAANYISEVGLGWFPGYAIDVETGERLNIVYGESSFLTGDNGADMMWNPSSREGSKLYEARNRLTSEGVYFGGKHFIYIMGHNATKTKRDNNYFPAYDGGEFFIDKINDPKKRYRKRELFVNAMWCAIPILDERYFSETDIADDPYGFVKSDLKIRFRVVGQYCVDVLDYAKPDSVALNANMPMYEFNTGDLATMRNDNPTAVSALDLINIVPNPYYGNSSYERSQFDNYVKLINLPRFCSISIYSLNGNLVRRFTKDAHQTWLKWDIKNTYGIPIASGVYIFHIEAPGIGEKVLKWFGVLRPQDLHSL